MTKTSPSFSSALHPPAWLLILLILVIALRLPSLFEPFRYTDENIYLVLGQALKKGLVFYRDIHDNKPPLLYLIAAISGNVFYFRLFLLLANLTSIYFFYKLASLLFPKKPLFSPLSTTIFAIISSIPLLEGNIANSEIFMICPTIIAFYLILSSKKPTFFFLAGACMSLALLLKVPAIFDILALFLFLLTLLKTKNSHKVKTWLSQNLALALGFIFPVTLTIIYYASQSALSQYISLAFLQNLGYLSSLKAASPPTPFWIKNLSLLIRACLALSLSLSLLFLNRKKFISSSPSLFLLWLTWSSFAAFLSERPYPHYLIQTLPPLSLSVTWLALDRSLHKLISLPFLILLLAGTIYYRFYYAPTYPYYINFFKLITKQISQDQYLAFFGDKYPSRYQLARFITTTTNPEDKIFVWGTDPEIYALTRRLPVGRYTVSYHIFDFHGQSETLTALTQKPPKYIIVTESESRPWPELSQFINKHYSLAHTFGDAKVYFSLPDSINK